MPQRLFCATASSWPPPKRNASLASSTISAFRGTPSASAWKREASRQSILPAITHVDGTGRLQTVFRDESPRYYALIERFGQSTGVPVVLNTSFNLKGEPIVNTPANAFHTFSKSEMDALVLENFLIEKKAP